MVEEHVENSLWFTVIVVISKPQLLSSLQMNCIEGPVNTATDKQENISQLTYTAKLSKLEKLTRVGFELPSLLP